MANKGNVAHYKAQATMLNGGRKEVIKGKGRLNNQISSLILEKLYQSGIQTHFIKSLSETEQLNQRVDMIPLEMVLRNYAAGSFSKRFGMKEGIQLPQPIVECYYKQDELDDPFINDEHVAFLEIATADELAYLKQQTRKINQVLIELFAKIDLTLGDCWVDIHAKVYNEVTAYEKAHVCGNDEA